MVATYEEIAGTRPRIRRDVLYTKMDVGVHFHNARGGFSVVMPSAYRFAQLIVPHLTGEHTVEALCRGLGDKQRAMVAQLVGTLYARGFARDAVPPAAGSPVPEPAVAERFAAQIAYVDHYSDGAAERFLRFRRTRVAVLGDDRLARWAALSLIRNGCAAVALPAAADTPGNRLADIRAEAAALAAQDCPASLELLQAPATGGDFGWQDLDGHDVVLVTGARAARQTAALARVPAGRMLVPAWGFGGSVVIGPLGEQDARGCWTCAALRLAANGDAADAADLWRSLASLAPPPGDAASGAAGAPAPGAAPDTAGADGPVRGPVAAMIGNLLAYEVFRLTTGALPAETRGHLLVQDLDSLDTASEPLLPHPACPSCAPARADRPAPAPLRLEDLAHASGPEDLAGPGERPGLGGQPGLGDQAGPGDPAGHGDPEEAADAGGPAGTGDAAGAAVTALAERPEEDAAKAALAEITDRDILVQPAAGVFRRFDDETWAQTPLKVSTVELNTGHRAPRSVAAFDVHHVAGARLRALQRAAEVYAEHVVPLPEVLTGPSLEAARDKWEAIDPRRLSTASGLAAGDVPAAAPGEEAPDGAAGTGPDPAVPPAAERSGAGAGADAVDAGGGAGAGVGVGADTVSVGAWCTAVSLLGGETVLVPAAALRTFGPFNRDRLAEPTRAGTGAGRTPREAAARGVLTALAHDTLRRALHGLAGVAAVDPAALEAAGDPELTFLVRSAANLEAPLAVLLLGGSGGLREDAGSPRDGAGGRGGPDGPDPSGGRAAPVPVVLARAGGHWALGAGLRRRDALLEAVRDVLGAVQLSREPGAPAAPDTGDPLLADLDPAALVATESAAPDLDGGTDWAALAAALRGSGHDLLAAPVHAPDLAAGRLHVTRVLLTSGGAPHAR